LFDRLQGGSAMIEFFKEGGWGMWPILVIGVILVVSSGRYAIDREPVRLRFVTVLSFGHLAFIAGAVLTDMATVLWAVSAEGLSEEIRTRILLEGMKESTRPGVLGLLLLGVALVLVSIGVYRAGLSELRAARGD
jgi:uncharacterized membrane protein YqhA